MLEDYAAAPMAHLDAGEQKSIVESITQRIADIDARMQAFDPE